MAWKVQVHDEKNDETEILFLLVEDDKTSQPKGSKKASPMFVIQRR